MTLILVVERENRYTERIQDSLATEGYRVRTVGGRAEALQAAAAEAPDLVIASAEAPGAEALAVTFSRRSGGPGLIALMPERLESDSAGAIEADEFLIKPFTEQDLRQCVRRTLASRRSGGEIAVPADAQTSASKLTSHDIFGDVLAEVEDEVRSAAAPAPRPPTASTPNASPSAANTTDPRSEVERKLEQTLSGVLGTMPIPKAKTSEAAFATPIVPPTAPTAPRKSVELPSTDVEALLSRTLSSLDLGKTTPQKPRPAVPTPPVVAPPPIAVVAPPPPQKVEPERPLSEPLKVESAPPTPVETPSLASTPPPTAPAEGLERTKTGTGRPRPVGDFDIAELEQLARTAKRPDVSVQAPAPVQTPPQAPPSPPTAQAGSPAPSIVMPPKPAAPTKSVASDVAATQRIPVFTGDLEDGTQGFGQYTLLERIAVGGMAEVWKARMRGVEGFQKTVAIKRILPHMTHNAEFVGMFIDEAKLAAQLSHPNIIHIYDLGKIGADYYIAMEYVDGKDLRAALNLARQKNRPLPYGLALLIGNRLAAALEHAHRKRDFDGRELGLVHRDVSPQNVLLTTDGDIKLCDFGIAKAVSKAGQTQMGALKGKLQYMSPEQAWGRPVDARSDIFSLGALLYEMLTGERLFAGDSEISVLESVREGRVRGPRDIAPSLPPEVDAVVRKALARTPEERFQSAGELEARLGELLAEVKPTPSHSDLASYLRRLDAPADAAVETPPAPKPETPIVAPPPVVVASPIPESRPDPSPAPVRPAEPTPPVPAPAVVSAAHDEAEYVEAVAPLGDVVLEAPKKSRAALWIALAALLAIGGGAALYFSGFGRSKAAPSKTEPAPALPAPATSSDLGLVSDPALQTDLTGLVGDALAKRQQELEKDFVEKEKQLRDELAKSQAAKAKEKERLAAATAPPAAPTTAPTPQAAPPVEEVRRPDPEPEPPPQAPVVREEPRPVTPPPPAPAREEVPKVNVGDLVTGGPGVNPPQLVSAPRPSYPPLARRLGVQGVVVVSVLVDENGRVVETRIVEPIKENVGINEAAVAAARGAQYKPATKSGVRVKMWTRLRIPFKL